MENIYLYHFEPGSMCIMQCNSHCASQNKFYIIGHCLRQKSDV